MKLKLIYNFYKDKMNNNILKRYKNLKLVLKTMYKKKKI